MHAEHKLITNIGHIHNYYDCIGKYQVYVNIWLTYFYLLLALKLTTIQ